MESSVIESILQKLFFSTVVSLAYSSKIVSTEIFSKKLNVWCFFLWSLNYLNETLSAQILEICSWGKETQTLQIK